SVESRPGQPAKTFCQQNLNLGLFTAGTMLAELVIAIEVSRLHLLPNNACAQKHCIVLYAFKA
ncbi:hypothetical protein B8X00_10200, partial [Acetobacter fabarum]